MPGCGAFRGVSNVTWPESATAAAGPAPDRGWRTEWMQWALTDGQRTVNRPRLRWWFSMKPPHPSIGAPWEGATWWITGQRKSHHKRPCIET
jgi:hypothetical protein